MIQCVARQWLEIFIRKYSQVEETSKSYITIPYVNIDTQVIKIDNFTTLGFVKPVTQEKECI